MAHQTHALPWNTLVAHYKYKVSYTHETQRQDIFAIENKETIFFCRALAKHVQELSETERAKFKPQAELRERAKGWTKSVPSAAGKSPGGSKTKTRMVYPDEMQKRYVEGGNEETDLPSRVPACYCQNLQQLTQWTECAHGSRSAHADTVKIMMMEAAGTPPAICASPDRAANKPEVGLLRFVTTEYGHRHPVCRVAEEALRAYLYLNLLVVMQEQGVELCDCSYSESGEEIPGRRKYMDLVSYGSLLSSVAGEYDGDAQNLVHWDFFYARDERGIYGWDRSKPKDVLADIEALQGYFKGVWRVLVVYDLVIREAGGDPGLEDMCKFTLPISFF
ncbi:hypothetical protein PG991_009387 [Apiospora marii]|uniref:Uncharacterized protein n=1 Tax=Apiospora marii TaxID=335849 RepID=A0ABR1RKJ0_9PEZI